MEPKATVEEITEKDVHNPKEKDVITHNKKEKPADSDSTTS